MPRGNPSGMTAALGADMSKSIPAIQKFMTTTPHSIGADQTLAHAHAVMREFRIRHLPVLVGGKLVGMVTDRDPVEDAMVTDVYSVDPETPVDEVVREMAQHKYGSVVVMQNQKVVGIFTTVDVCTAFADMLHTRLAK